MYIDLSISDEANRQAKIKLSAMFNHKYMYIFQIHNFDDDISSDNCYCEGSQE